MQWRSLYSVTRGWLEPYFSGLCVCWRAVKSRMLGWPSIKPGFHFRPKWPQWGVPNMLGFSPMLYLCLALGAALPVTYGVLKVQEARRVQAAFAKGEETGAARVAAAVSAKTAETVAAAEEGRTEVAAVPVDKAAIKALCAKSASCRNRGAL